VRMLLRARGRWEGEDKFSKKKSIFKLGEVHSLLQSIKRGGGGVKKDASHKTNGEGKKSKRRHDASRKTQPKKCGILELKNPRDKALKPRKTGSAEKI